MWASKAVLSHSEFYKRYEENKVELEKKEKAYADRFCQITQATDSAFRDLGLTYQVVKNTSSGGVREFDGEGKVQITLNLAKSLRDKMKEEGVLRYYLVRQIMQSSVPVLRKLMTRIILGKYGIRLI